VPHVRQSVRGTKTTGEAHRPLSLYRLADPTIVPDALRSVDMCDDPVPKGRLQTSASPRIVWTNECAVQDWEINLQQRWGCPISRFWRDAPNFLHVALDKTACAPFFKERRIRFAEPINLHRKLGMWDTTAFHLHTSKYPGLHPGPPDPTPELKAQYPLGIQVSQAPADTHTAHWYCQSPRSSVAVEPG
jgi:hypothetical protein